MEEIKKTTILCDNKDAVDQRFYFRYAEFFSHLHVHSFQTCNMKVFSALSVVVAVLLAVASAHRGTATLSRKCVAFIRDNFRNIYTKILQLEEEMKQQMDKAG